MVLPLSTLLFSHVFTAFLAFAAFALMLRERDGPASPMLLALAGLAMGYGVASEYPAVLRRGSCSGCTCCRVATRSARRA